MVPAVLFVLATGAALACATAAGPGVGLLPPAKRRAWAVAGVLALAGVGVVLARWPLTSVVHERIAIGILAVGAAACLLGAARSARPRGVGAAAVGFGFALALAGLAQAVAVDAFDPGGDAVEPTLAQDDPGDLLRARAAQLQRRLGEEIPAARGRLQQQVAEVRVALGEASEAQRVRLRDELREIARTLLALDVEERSTEELRQRVAQELRRFERLRATEHLIEDDPELRGELEQLAADAGRRLGVAVDGRLGSGAIAEARVDALVEEWLVGR